MPRRRASRHRDGITIVDVWRQKGREEGKQWLARVWSSTERRYVSQAFADYAEADQWAKEEAARLRLNLSSAKVVELPDVWASHRTSLLARRPPVHPSTIRNFELTVAALTAAGATRFSAKTFRAQVEQALSRMPLTRTKAGTGEAAASTLRRYLNHVKALVTHARRQGWLVRDPLAGLNPFTPPDSAREVFTLHELRAIAALDRHDSPRWLWVMLMIYTGLRHSEALALQWADIEWSARFIRVRKGKGNKRRTIAMMDELHALLAPLGGPDAQIPRLGPIVERRRREGCTWLAFRGLLRDAGVEADRGVDATTVMPLRLSAHTCRHTFAALMLASGVDGYDLQLTMGHSAEDLTQFYAQQRDLFRRQVEQEGWRPGKFVLRCRSTAAAAT